MRLGRVSVRTQILLIFVLCLAILGSGMIFVYAYMIADLEHLQRDRAFHLAEEHGRKVAGEILRLFEESEEGVVLDLSENPILKSKVVTIFEQFSRVLPNSLRGGAAELSDPKGDIVLRLRIAPPRSEVEATGSRLVADEANDNEKTIDEWFRKIYHRYPGRDRINLEFPIGREETHWGSLRFLIEQSSTYSDVEATGRKIQGYLWSLLLAFIGVLALGLYLMALLSRRQIYLLADNERLGRMAYVGTLASGLAHEIRNPLNAMSVNLSAAEEELEDADGQSPEIIGRALELAQREIQRLNRSVTGFMAFARPEANREQITDLRALVEEILELLHPRIEACGALVEVDLPDEACLQADFSGLRQVVYNIVLNGLQAMAETQDAPDDEGGAGAERFLRIGGRRESAQWFLWIEDNGPGIAPGSEEKVFNAFHTTKAAGSGFGLSIARAVIDSHGGNIQARQPADGGRGARIEITLPETSPGKSRARSKSGDNWY